jgi:hypothetical protein
MTDLSWWTDEWYEENVEEYEEAEEDPDYCEADIRNDRVCLAKLDKKGHCPNQRHHLRS